MSCCKVESMISIDERGQMVLPKEIREKANINPGDKLALITWENEGKVCCLGLIKADLFNDIARGIIEPLIST